MPRLSRSSRGGVSPSVWPSLICMIVEVQTPIIAYRDRDCNAVIGYCGMVWLLALSSFFTHDCRLLTITLFISTVFHFLAATLLLP